MRANWVMILVLLMVPGAVQAQGHGPDQERRAELERQVRHQFLTQVAQRLELTEDQREQVRAVLLESADARRDLARESQALRIDLMQAVRSEDAPMSRFEEILDRLEDVRTREREIAQQEEAALARILDPRQQAMFLMMRMQFNDRIRQMRGMPGAARGGAAGGPMGGPLGHSGPFI